MRATQFIAGAFTLAVAALSLPAMSTPVKFTRRDESPLVEQTTCNEGGDPITCSDATAACLQVPSSVSFKPGTGDTAKHLVSVGSASVFLTRAKSSSTFGNATALCLQIVNNCCPDSPGSPGSTMAKGEIQLPAGEKGSIQIIKS